MKGQKNKPEVLMKAQKKFRDNNPGHRFTLDFYKPDENLKEKFDGLKSKLSLTNSGLLEVLIENFEKNLET